MASCFGVGKGLCGKVTVYTEIEGVGNVGVVVIVLALGGLEEIPTGVYDADVGVVEVVGEPGSGDE